MVREKRVKVSKDTQVHMTTTYTRTGKGPKDNAKRSFNFVVKGLMISSMLVGSVLTSGLSALASTDISAQPINAPLAYESQQVEFADEVAMISNLKMAAKVLTAAIKTNQLTPALYDNVMKGLVSIDTKTALDGAFKKSDELIPLINATDKLLKYNIKNPTDDVLASRSNSISALESVQSRYGLTGSADQFLAKQGVVVTSVAEPKSTAEPTSVAEQSSEGVIKAASIEAPQAASVTKAASITEAASSKAYTTLINGELLDVPVPSRSVTGGILVPARAVAESLGGSIISNKDGSVSIVNGAQKVTVKRSTHMLTVNGKSSKTAVATTINAGHTMVSTDVIQKAFPSAKITYTTSGKKVNFTLAGASVTSPSGVDSAYLTKYTTLFNGKEVDLGVFVQSTNRGFVVPLRGVFERLGGKITTARGTTVTVKSGANVLTLTRGSNVATINGQKFTMASPVTTIEGNTMVSVEVVTKLFPNVKVTHSTSSKKINFTYGSGGSNTGGGTVTSPVKEDVYGIKVNHGRHTYKSANQAEYDAVMGEVNKTLAGVDFTKLDTSIPYLKGVDSYLNGARYVGDPSDANREDRYIGMAELHLKQLVDSGVSKQEIIKLVNLSLAVYGRIGDASTAVDNRINSAYHVLVQGEFDCDSYAQALSSFYDKMGYNTAIHATTSHASALVEIGGKWYNVEGGVFQQSTVTDSTFINNPSMFLEQPTY